MKTNLYYPPNTSVAFDNDKATVRVSLCIPKELQPFLSGSFRTKKGKYVVSVHQTMPTSHFTPEYMSTVYEKLIHRLKVNVRTAKANMYSQQVKELEEQGPRQLSLFAA